MPKFYPAGGGGAASASATFDEVYISNHVNLGDIWAVRITLKLDSAELTQNIYTAGWLSLETSDGVNLRQYYFSDQALAGDADLVSEINYVTGFLRYASPNSYFMGYTLDSSGLRGDYGAGTYRLYVNMVNNQQEWIKSSNYVELTVSE